GAFPPEAPAGIRHLSVGESIGVEDLPRAHLRGKGSYVRSGARAGRGAPPGFQREPPGEVAPDSPDGTTPRRSGLRFAGEAHRSDGQRLGAGPRLVGGGPEAGRRPRFPDLILESQGHVKYIPAPEREGTSRRWHRCRY